MHELDDPALLRQYLTQGSEAAFAALVARHVDKVYSVALRHTRNPHAAEEITQAVFVILAKKSGRLGAKVVLSGWLYETARLTALTHIRREIRRARREQEAHMQTALNENADDVWLHIAPLLDDALAKLSAADRHAIVLRYFDGQSLGEVGAALGASEEAAKKRVARAVDKLRGWFTKRGVTLTATVLTAAISANSVQAAPLGLAKTISVVGITKGAALGGSTFALVKGVLNLMAWAKAKMAAAITAIILIVTGTTTVVLTNDIFPHEPAIVSRLKEKSLSVYPSYQDVRGVRKVKGLDVWGATNEAFMILGQMAGVQELQFTATDLKQRPFDEIEKMTSLKSLKVINCKFLPEQMKVIQNLTNLENLELWFTVMEESNETRAQLLGELSDEEKQTQDDFKRQRIGDPVIQAALITDRFMPCLSKLSKLKTLRLINTYESAKGLEPLSPLVHLETIDIAPMVFTGKSIAPFLAMPHLHSLRYFNADDGIIDTLSNVKSLEFLNIWSGGVTDKGVSRLTGLTNLNHLEIRGNKMSDEGFMQLTLLPKLKYLDIQYAETISTNGVAQFQKLRPDVGINH